MGPRPLLAALLLSGVAAGAPVADPAAMPRPRSDPLPDVAEPTEIGDPTGDTRPRPTVPPDDVPEPGPGTMPDVIAVKIGGWSMNVPGGDPFAGSWTTGNAVQLFRMDIVFAGRVNPPGTLGVGTVEFDPFKHGPNPVFGFIEIDVDGDIDTGGECVGATQRYLANVARFGSLPPGVAGARAARSADDYNAAFGTGRQFQRSGADFAVTFCGCFPVTVVQRIGNGGAEFGPGDTWIVRGRFFQRSGGYDEASAAFGGSLPQRYDPLVNLRFSHNAASNRTTVTLIYPLTMLGASIMTGEPEQAPDYNVANHTSIEEALLDIIAGASKPLSTCAQTLSSGWIGQTPSSSLDPTRWRSTAIVGTAYPTPQAALYFWTDVAFTQRFGDLTADGRVTATDALAHDFTIAALDGGPLDLDDLVNSAVVIQNFGPNFHLADLDGNGVIDAADRFPIYSMTIGDFNGDCQVNGADLSVLLANFGLSASGQNPIAGDANGDDRVDAADLSVLLGNFGGGCPGID